MTYTLMICARTRWHLKIHCLLKTQGSVKNYEGSFIRFNDQQFIGACPATVINVRESSSVVKLIFIRNATE